MHFRFEAIENVRDLAVGISLSLGFPQHFRGYVLNGVLREVLFEMNELLNLAEEPRVNLGGFENASERDAQLECIVHMKQTVPAGVTQALHDRVLVAEFAPIGTQTVSLDFQRLACLLQGFLEGATNGHDLSHRLHLQPEFTVAPRELVEVPTWNLDHDVVERRLEHG